METCKKCGYPGIVKTQTCPRCGSSLVKQEAKTKCACGRVIGEGDKSCPDCNRPLN